jgi:hypothetical protein
LGAPVVQGAPFSINQASFRSDQQWRALFYQSGKLGRPFLSFKQCAKNLEWMKEWPNPDQLAGTE